MGWRDSVLLATRYPVHSRDSVLSGLRYPVDWQDSVLLPPPGTLGTGGTQYFQPPRYPMEWWVSVLSVTR